MSPITASKKKSQENSSGVSVDKLLSQSDFLRRYSITPQAFRDTGIKWRDLESIFNDYIESRHKLDHPATAVVNIFLSKEAKDQGVHSVRYRVKDPNSLVEKIIRKKIENPKTKTITVTNYKSEITDLIGIRILHTFKYDWYGIHNFITNMFYLKNNSKPIVYHREGDEKEFLDTCKECGCKKMRHPKGYRSVHYIISIRLTKEKIFAEVQVRTIFEEGWSEIDHKIRYSYKGHKESPFDNELRQLNGIAGNADEIGSTIKKRDQDEQGKIMAQTKKSGGK